MAGAFDIENVEKPNPTKQSQVIAQADKICEMIAAGVCMYDISKEIGVSCRTIYLVAGVDKGFSAKFKEAREQQINLTIKEMKAVAESEIPSDSKGTLSSAFVRDKEVRLTTMQTMLRWTDSQRFGDAKSAQTFVDIPEFVAAESAADKLKVLSNAAATKRISLEASEKLAKLCEAQFKMDDVLSALKTMSDRLSALETDTKPELNLIKSA